MNWLAHTLLSKRDVEYQLGNILADPLKGKLWQSASQALHDGVKMHQSIDGFTDGHQTISLCKSRLGDKGHLKGVVLDLLFDHFLSINWQNFSSMPLDQFLDDFHVNAAQAVKKYPPRPKQLIEGIIRSELLFSYGSFDGFIQSLKRIEKRLSPRVRAKDSIMRYVQLVEQEYDNLQHDFLGFFPELIEFFKNHELGDPIHHFMHE